jgi:hypothetical protein
MVWSDWGAKPQIVRGGMDGTEVTPFVMTGAVWPNGLALDYPLNDLYWVDAKLDRIDAIHVDNVQVQVRRMSYIRILYIIRILYYNTTYVAMFKYESTS